MEFNSVGRGCLYCTVTLTKLGHLEKCLSARKGKTNCRVLVKCERMANAVCSVALFDQLRRCCRIWRNLSKSLRGWTCPPGHREIFRWFAAQIVIPGLTRLVLSQVEIKMTRRNHIMYNNCFRRRTGAYRFKIVIYYQRTSNSRKKSKFQ